MKKYSGTDRRRDPRRTIVESFSFFLSIPSKGGSRIPIVDISEVGVAFDAEGFLEFKNGEALELELYLNQSLSIPLVGKTVRVQPSKKHEDANEIAIEFHDRKHKGVIGLTSFLKLLDSLVEIAHVDS